MRATSLAFVGLNALRLTSLVVVTLMLTTLIMGFVEDVRAYHDGDTMEEARDDDCAYVPGTWIPMQTWGVFWVALHRLLLIFAAITLFFAELSWFHLQKLTVLVEEWMPCLSSSKGLASLGVIQAAVATSLLSHYLDEFPLVVGWMLFGVGNIYVSLGILFRARPLRDVRSFSATRRQQATQLVISRHDSHNVNKTCERGPAVTTTMFSKLLRRGKNDQKKPSINETFPTLEMPSHQELLREGMRRESHRRQASSVAIDIDIHQQQADQNDELDNAEAAKFDRVDNKKERSSVSSSESLNFGSSAESSTQVRIGGYSTPRATLAREKAQQRRVARRNGQGDRRNEKNPELIDNDEASSPSHIRITKRSAAFVSSARSRLSTTPSFFSERRRTPRRGIPNVESIVATQYTEDRDTAPPLPPLPAYHPTNVI